MTVDTQDLKAKTLQSLGKPLSLNAVALVVRLTDLILIGLAGATLFFVYVAPRDGVLGENYVAGILIVITLFGLLAQQLDVYDDRHILSFGRRSHRIAAAWALTFALLLAAAFALKISDHFSRVWAFAWFLGTPGLLVLSRLLLNRWVGAWAQDGRFAQRSVIVGSGEAARRLARHLADAKDPLAKVLGYVDEPNRVSTPSDDSAGCPRLGSLEDLIEMIRAEKVDQVFLALSWNDEERLQTVIKLLAVTPVAIRLAPDLIGFQFTGRSFTAVANLPMLRLFDRPISGWSHLAKALEDRLLASLILVLISPVMLAVAVAIKLESRGSVFFKQPRYGFNNQLIEVWKFRSMYEADADPDCLEQTVRDDPRVTGVGRLIRRFSLDELPQLFNVMGGSMSLVGPRPHAVATKAQGRLFEQIVEGYAARHRVRPGITGWAQVNGWRGETDTEEKIEQRVEHDLYYIDNWSVGFDLWIILRTFLVVLHDDKAY